MRSVPIEIVAFPVGIGNRARPRLVVDNTCVDGHRVVFRVEVRVIGKTTVGVIHSRVHHAHDDAGPVVVGMALPHTARARREKRQVVHHPSWHDGFHPLHRFALHQVAQVRRITGQRGNQQPAGSFAHRHVGVKPLEGIAIPVLLEQQDLERAALDPPLRLLVGSPDQVLLHVATHFEERMERLHVIDSRHRRDRRHGLRVGGNRVRTVRNVVLDHRTVVLQGGAMILRKGIRELHNVMTGIRRRPVVLRDVDHLALIPKHARIDDRVSKEED